MTATKEHSPGAALTVANHIRLSRASLKKDLREGVVSLPEVLLSEYPDYLQKMGVGMLVKAVRGIGPDRCRILLREASFDNKEITENWSVGKLTERQRWTLAELVSA